MLLLHQVGSVKIGEVVRYTVTYNPSRDRILPSPEYLHLRIRNTSPIPLRAAFVHGPYTLHVSAYPSHFDPNVKFENPRRYGVPEFEPMLKAGGTWTCKLTVPDNIRQSAGAGAAAGNFHAPPGVGADGEPTTACWIIEVASQVMFSSSAAVGYEVLLARDEKSFNISSLPAVGNSSQVPQPGRVSDFQQSVGAKDGHHPAQHMGVYSKAITLTVEDTASLWNTPRLPDSTKHEVQHIPKTLPSLSATELNPKPQRKKKVHLVVLTHGLHSNLGADMLYMKESIDAAAKQARADRKARKAKEKSQAETAAPDRPHEARSGEGCGEDTDDNEEDDEEEVIVRGFSGNATKTERGIKFLGKRLARYVLSMTYPDQPYLPSFQKVADGIPTAVKHDDPKSQTEEGVAKSAHKHSTIHLHKHTEEAERAYKVTSISLIGHSLGGLVQMYAIAYIQKHSPEFFTQIKPINFIAMASPLLGLSNENPIYVKFALDFGLVGRTGRDLGLTWRAPTIARSGWGALMGSLGESAHKKVVGETQPESKPLLRILPTGPAHTALKQFRNRTVYSNVVNDGIVPLRTACLLFLDWQGLGRVEKARREAGLVETVMGFGWAELTGANVSARRGPWQAEREEEVSIPPSPSDPEGSSHDGSREVPQPAENAMLEDDRQSLHLAASMRDKYNDGSPGPESTSQTNNDFPFAGIFNFFKSGDSSKAQKTPPHSPRDNRIYRRSQTLKVDESRDQSTSPARSTVTSGNELEEEHENGPPPRTTILEAAGDLLNPVMPTVDYFLDPSKRPRTIFHDRVYHPSDIPPPPTKKRSTGLSFRRKSYTSANSQSSTESPPHRGTGESGASTPHEPPTPGIKKADSTLSTGDYYDSKNHPKLDPDEVVDSSSMKVEEKIARAYHRDLSWRKVLVKMEPDAHNNIIVRRMFSNAHGWPVVKHLCDTHFSDAASARTADSAETNAERAKAPHEDPSSMGAETSAQPQGKSYNMDSSRRESSLARTDTENLEADDDVPDLPSQAQERGSAPHSTHHHHSHSTSSSSSSPSASRPSPKRIDSATWSDRDFADSGDDSEWDADIAYGGDNATRLQPPPSAKLASAKRGDAGHDEGGSSEASGWNWTEKIVGKGAQKKKQSPSSTVPASTTAGPISPTAATPTGTASFSLTS
ncbi:putative serine esterase-domain-containing protein [Microdochium trichocladiopsis]|uniref:Serine esterase-domain-containing protein n=1 Tax=Microdochium trichocladiopsis TaxID=1682393 RepID=A0A9P8YEG7_9PEZI|nr:putative serine esterase-domain-containing protein [Microdochium trichocladiopsis]KAH7035456.1 putative serine esterase-domain-containing protein [Microdochium trichocladiopsis]